MKRRHEVRGKDAIDSAIWKYMTSQATFSSQDGEKERKIVPPMITLTLLKFILFVTTNI